MKKKIKYLFEKCIQSFTDKDYIIDQEYLDWVCDSLIIEELDKRNIKEYFGWTIQNYKEFMDDNNGMLFKVYIKSPNKKILYEIFGGLKGDVTIFLSNEVTEINIDVPKNMWDVFELINKK